MSLRVAEIDNAEQATTSAKPTSIVFATLKDAVGQRVSIETADCSTYTGVLADVDARYMNARFAGKVLIKRKDGFVEVSRDVLLPGRGIKLFVLPKEMRQAAFFQAIASGEWKLSKTAQKKRNPKAAAKAAGGPSLALKKK